MKKITSWLPSLTGSPRSSAAWGLDRLARWSIGRPRTAIAVFVGLVLLAAPGLLRLELRTDGHALVPADDPAVRFDAAVRERFGLHDPIIVVLETGRPGGIYDARVLRRLRDLTSVLARLDGVAPGSVMSLATEKRDRVYPGTLDFRPFLDPVPDTPLYMELFRGDLEAVRILHGTLVSRDRSAVAILAGAPNLGKSGQGADRVALYRRIVAEARPFDGGGVRVSVVGAPVAESLLGTHILEDLALLLPLSIAMISLSLWVGCRRLWGVLLGLAEVAAGQVWTFGMMGWLGVPVYLTTAILPVLLTALALADEIHLFWRYQKILGPETTEADREHPAAVRRLMDQMTRALALTSLTTIIGFFSFVTSPLAPVRMFGLTAAAGLFFCMLWSLSVGPATLALLPPSALRRPVGASAARPGDLIRRWLAPVYRHPRRTLAGIALMTLAIGAGAERLYVQDSWVDSFAPGSPFRRDTERVNQLFLGTHLLLVELDLSQWQGTLPEQVSEGQPGPLLDPETLREIGRFESFLGTLPGVGGVLGPTSHLTMVSYLRHARDERQLRIPDSADDVSRVIGWFDEVRGKTRRREVIDDARRHAVITLFLKAANYRQVARLMEAARRYAGTHLAPRGVRIGFAGDVAVSQAMIPAIVTTQVNSLLLAPLGSMLVIIALCRSVRTGIVVSLPALLAIAWVFGIMGWTGIPLGVATSMFCAITLGVGVDYGIHLYECFLRHREEQTGGTAEAAALAAAADAGPAIVTDTIAISLGFLILAFSQVPPNARLGFLVAAALTVSSLLTLAGLGTLLARSR